MTRLVTDRFIDHARRQRGRAALVIGADCLRRDELRAGVEQVAQALENVTTPGARVALWLDNSAAFVTLFLGTVMARRVAMVMDRKWPAQQRADVLADVPPDLVFAAPESCDELAGQTTAPVVAVHSTDAAVAAMAALPPCSTIDPAATGHPADPPLFIGFTSGTTGRPKGFIRSHGSWLKSFDASGAEFATSDRDCICAPGPLVHGISLYAVVEALCAGATACILPRFDATAAIDQITSRNATVITAVPTILDFIAREAEVRDLTLPSLRLVLSSGAGLPPPLAARLSAVCPNAEIADYYGASELSFVSVRRGQELTVPGAPSRPFHGVDIQIRRPDGSLADAGETGTVFVRSEMISDGYVRHHDDAGFRRDGDWASVGDLGFLDRAGRLHLIGRESGMLITGGLNVFPEETEAVLLAQPEVASAAVIGMADETWGEVVTAVICWQHGESLSLQELQQRCATTLPRYKWPRRLFIADRLPLTASGKVARAAVRTSLINGDPAFREVKQ